MKQALFLLVAISLFIAAELSAITLGGEILETLGRGLEVLGNGLEMLGNGLHFVGEQYSALIEEAFKLL